MRARAVAGILVAGSALLFAPAASASDPVPAPAPSAGAPPPGPKPQPGELPPIWFDEKNKLRLDLHGSLWLWFYQPLVQLEDPRPGAKLFGPGDHLFEIYQASVEISAKWDRFGVYINPRFRDTKSREFFTSNVWLQQAYASYEAPHARIAAGKIENAFSRLIEESWYASLLYDDGIKGETDYGLSVDGSFSPTADVAINYHGQYFVTDGRTNLSNPDRDTVWVTGGRREHIFTGRVEPSYRIDADSSIRGGFALQAFHVDLGDGKPHEVLRVDLDASYAKGPLHAGVEGVVQVGESVTSYPFAPTATTPGRASAHNYYLVAGGGIRLWRFYPRYSLSLARYADANVFEMIHVPGVTFTAHDNVAILFEYGFWQRRDPGKIWSIDNSINLLVNGRF